MCRLAEAHPMICHDCAETVVTSVQASERRDATAERSPRLLYGVKRSF